MKYNFIEAHVPGHPFVTFFNPIYNVNSLIFGSLCFVLVAILYMLRVDVIGTWTMCMERLGQNSCSRLDKINILPCMLMI